MGKYSVKWRNEEVGSFDVKGIDMWYLEGEFVPNDTALAKEFNDLVKTFDFKKVFKNHKLGTTIEMTNEEGIITSIVQGYIKNTFCVRMMTSKEGIELVNKESIQ